MSEVERVSSAPYSVGSGMPRPLGATVRDGGVNFALYTEHATAVELLLYARAGDAEPLQTIVLEHRQNRSVNCWHVFVDGVGHGQLYAWRVHGPWQPERGHRFDAKISLVDPYARLVVPRGTVGADTHGGARSGAFVAAVVDPSGFDWQGVVPPRTRPTDRIIYEMHVAGFTRHPSSGLSGEKAGSFDGLIDKIPYLVDLGVTTVELLPIFAFDPHTPDRTNPKTGQPLTDYWGYNPLSFFAPHHAYLDRADSGADAVRALQELVRALHAAGLEVILDVVFNHTGEHGLDGPTQSLRGVDNSTYYIVRRDGSGRYEDFSGCGNTVRCNHPAVRRLILDSLRYWTTMFHVDGFRFDLASILSRDDDGRPIDDPPILWEIEGDPVLEHATLIAEAWDAGGLYQVGRFPGERWCEWNGRFRDDVRRFWRGDDGMSGVMAQRMLGSPDLYEAQDRQPAQAVNFVTCHDGFTLADLVAYAKKHNIENGEDERDGSDHEHSYNCGAEGPTSDHGIRALRLRMQKNLLATLFLAQGTPMLLGGDEIGRTQHGNNNAWCQDNPIAWLDWDLTNKNVELYRFTRALIHFRRAHHSLHRSRYLLGYDAPAGHDSLGYPRVRWHGRKPDAADWSATNHLLCFTLTPASDDVALHIMLNGTGAAAEVVLPPAPRGHVWKRAIDTARTTPDDILGAGAEVPVDAAVMEVAGRSVVVLVEDAPRPSSPARPTQMIALPSWLRKTK